MHPDADFPSRSAGAFGPLVSAWQQPSDRVFTRPATVLVVDDEDDLRLLVRLRLESHRTDRSIEVVGEARDGVEALDVFDALVCSRPPDVVILDHHMPGLTGTEVAERMLSVAPTQRIVLFSADLTPDLIEQARAIGIRRCVGKEAINALAEIVLDVDGRT